MYINNIFHGRDSQKQNIFFFGKQQQQQLTCRYNLYCISQILFVSKNIIVLLVIGINVIIIERSCLKVNDI